MHFFHKQIRKNLLNTYSIVICYYKILQAQVIQTTTHSTDCNYLNETH